MKTLSRKSQFAVLWALIKDYANATRKTRCARICFSCIKKHSEIVTEEKIRAAIYNLVMFGGNWELAFNALRSLPCFLPSDLDKLRAWVRSKKGGAL